MNILQINNYFYRKGGAETHFLDLIELLESKGHKVITFSTKDQKNLNNQYSSYWPKFNNLKYFLNFKANQKIKKLLDDEKIDLAHIHNLNYYLSPLILKTLKKRKIPIIMTVHDYSLISPNYNLYLHNKFNLKNIILTIEFCLRKLLFPYNKLVNIFIAPSKFMENKLKIHGFKNIVLINNFAKVINNQTTNIKDYFLYFGRLSKEKGLKNFIKILKKIKKDFKFYLAGVGPEKNKLIKLVNNLNLDQKIKFLGYQDKNTKLPQLINNAQFVVVPSLCSENCSLSILESMAQGKIVLAPNLGGNSELIDNQTGFLYNPNDELDLLDKINILIDNRESILELGQKAQKIAKLKFNEENYYQKLMEVYKKVIND